MNSTLSRYGSNYSQEIHDGRDVYQTADFIRIYSQITYSPSSFSSLSTSSERRYQFPTLQTRYPKTRCDDVERSHVEPPSQDRKKKRLFFWYTPEDLYNTIRRIIFIHVYMHTYIYKYISATIHIYAYILYINFEVSVKARRWSDKLTKIQFIYLTCLHRSTEHNWTRSVDIRQTDIRKRRTKNRLSFSISKSLKSRVRRACVWAGFSSLIILLGRSGILISYSCRSRTVCGDSASSYSCSCVRSACRERASWERWWTWWLRNNLKQRSTDGILAFVLIICERRS